MQPFCALLFFLAVRNQSILRISLKVSYLVPGQSCSFPNVSETVLMAMGNFSYESTKKWQHTNDKTKQNCMYILREIL